MNKEILTRIADNIRILSAAMVEKAGSGHPGGAMGGADFISVLFSEFLRFDPKDMSWTNRDRFFLDPAMPLTGGQGSAADLRCSRACYIVWIKANYNR